MLRITAPIEFGQLFLGRVLGDFMRQYPQITAEVELTSRHVDPVEEGVDIAILVGQPQDSTLIARKMFETSRRSMPARTIWLAWYAAACAELAGHRRVCCREIRSRYWPLLGESIACQRIVVQ